MRSLAAALLAAAAAMPAAAAVHQYSSLALSLDGGTIATVESAAAAKGRAVVTLRAADDGHILATADPCGSCTYAGLSFGPDGSLALIARTPGAGSAALVVVSREGRARTVATVAGLAQSPRFSPDGKRIALLVTLGANKETGATQPGVRQVGEIGETSDEQRLAIVDLAAGGAPVAAVPLSPADRYIYEYDWAPDGHSLVVTSARGNGDNNWWVATLDAVDAATGAIRPIARPAIQINQPRVSPDGKSIAFIGGLMSDFGATGGDAWTVPAAGGTPTHITAGARATVTGLDWTDGGLRALRLAGDQAQLAALGHGAPAAPLWSRPASFAAGAGRSGAAWSADGRRVAMVVQDYTHPPAIYAGPADAPVAITHDNDALRPAVTARSISWSSDGYVAQGWLIGPLAPAEPGRKAPMIVDVHGGPSSATTPRFIEQGRAATDYTNEGYWVFYPNPRGSFGQGEAFTAANRRDFGGGDLRDILAGVDAAEKMAPIDDKRLGLIGCSYGGFMAMWANTQTDRFKAIVAGAGISNWVSYYGTNGIDQWMIPFTGKSVYDDYKVYEDMSAVYHLKTAKTPTFIYVGERDIEVPPTQSVEWWHALKDRGVPVSLVIYPDAGHCVTRADQAADVRARSVAWLNKYVRDAQ